VKHARFHFAILAAVVISFFPVTRNQFVNWDDQETLYQNPGMNPPTWSAAAGYWRQPAGDLYIPVTYTIWAGVAEIAWDGKQLTPAAFHWASLLCHALSAMVVFQLLKLFIDADWPCLAGALLFALHPLQVESVAWASGFKDVLSGLLSLTAIWLFLLSAKSKRRLPYILSLIAFPAAMLAKPVAITAPLVAACLDQLLLRRPWRKTLLELLPPLACVIPILIIALFVQPAPFVPRVPLFDRPRVAADAVTFYLSNLLVPIHLTVDYGRPPDWVVAHPFTWLTMLVALSVGFVIWQSRKIPFIPASAAAFIIPLLPVLGFVPFEYQYYSTVADHYLYVALLGPALLFAYVLNRRPWRFFPTAILIACAVLTFHQARYWQNTVTLFQHNLRVNPTSFAAHRNLAYEDVRNGIIPRAIDGFQQALTIRPDDAITHYDLGNCYYRFGDPVSAITQYSLALRQMPDDPAIHYNLGQALRRIGREDDARQQLDEAAQLSHPP